MSQEIKISDSVVHFQIYTGIVEGKHPFEVRLKYDSATKYGWHIDGLKWLIESDYGESWDEYISSKDEWYLIDRTEKRIKKLVKEIYETKNS
jgi:hypothetical protein